MLLVAFLAGPAVRGIFQLLQALVRRVRAFVRRVVFRLESKWRIEAAELIDALPAFDDLPVEILNDLAGRVTLRGFRPGQAVFRQGDRPTAFYVVRKGRVEVEEEDPDSGDTQVLRTLERGDSFGEMGLLESAPREATVRAIDDVRGLRDRQGDVRPTLVGLDPRTRIRADDAGDGRAPRAAAVRRTGNGEPGRDPRTRALDVAATRHTTRP